MDFRLPLTPKPFTDKIRHRDKLFLIGSCFTEQIGQKLAAHKFRVMDNPHGILFNPVSISRSLRSYIKPDLLTKQDLFEHNELWGSWEHHTRFSHPDPHIVLDRINHSQVSANEFLAEADWALLTLGSAFVYERQGQVVANCHKVPTDKFNKRLLSVQETVQVLRDAIQSLQAFNKGIKCIFTISPVRHLRDGFVENNRSKATLILAVEELIASMPDCFYFPAYELVIDDLRDYRFYAEDMVHPNYAATNYVWEKFLEACVDEADRKLMKEIADIRSAANHKPFHPTSNAHRAFLASSRDKLIKLKEQYPYIDFEEELAIFDKQAT